MDNKLELEPWYIVLLFFSLLILFLMSGFGIEIMERLAHTP